LKNILEIIEPTNKITLRKIMVWIKLFKLKKGFIVRNKYIKFIQYLLNSYPEITFFLLIIIISLATVSRGRFLESKLA
jgi:hypothetical protein